MIKLDLPLIERAASFLQGKIRKTPTEFSQVLSELLDVPVYFKLVASTSTPLPSNFLWRVATLLRSFPLLKLLPVG